MTARGTGPSAPEPPQMTILAGPNGAGKSTAAAALLPADLPFVNADEIAKMLPGYPSRAMDWEAGRVALARLDELASRRAHFAVETTLAARTYASRINRMRSEGYEVRLIFIWVPAADLSVGRVAVRVASGGHHIPEGTIRRRYEAGLRNFFGLYRPIVGRWEAFENATAAGLRIIAEGRGVGRLVVHRPEFWGLMAAGGQ